ncbi:MAG TPA: hypothetical protein VJB90_03225 [Candidatus Nanoarchaeia archaeon]|nr:hypothetical protein [Candidatus Nanoarchaeia archaeon]
METYASIHYWWKDLRRFAYKNKSFIDLIFILAYAIEQGILIFLVKIISSHIEIIVSLFALIVLTTFGLQKIVMESRIRILEKKVYRSKIEINEMSKAFLDEYRHNRHLLKRINEERGN